ncbi:TIGR02757 family protein [Dyadobacter sp. CY312]|uniref:TIGR02757 family protein n=1 Tax=Dyadobacter sp. CY312 TaxID=2907303 RepID=UPI001F3005F4|nr:TIGR02757 family protein [Dyadobacter sp. CY312]MCE7039804.1 TIGR02757 family protein [Dyadobacter sp. CY312]
MSNNSKELSVFSAYVADLLEEKADQYNQPEFIPHDPISIPHRFTRKQDIEIMGFWAAILAWGQRKTIINKCLELSQLMDNAPHDFVLNHQESDLKQFLNFKHRTFNATDTLYFLHFFQDYYRQHDSLEYAFSSHLKKGDVTVENGLIGFHDLFSDSENFPARTRKHIATPLRKSSCKRLNMFLRWMVRKDDKGVDFGIWNEIKPAQLVCPCDVHVDRVARLLGLIKRPVTDWQTAMELTASLRSLSPTDPARYDFALFGLGIEGFATPAILPVRK